MPYFGPIIPPDSPLALPDKSRIRKRIVILAGFALFTFGVVAVALQGCNLATPVSSKQASVTNALPEFEMPPGSPPAIGASAAPATPTAKTRLAAAPRAAGAGREYRIAKGDTFEIIAKKFHVSITALEEANPGLEPKKLQIDQVIIIPPIGRRAASASQPTSLTSR